MGTIGSQPAAIYRMLSRLTAALVALDHVQESGRARGETEGGAELELSRILSCLDAPRQRWPDGWARPTQHPSQLCKHL
jgi:hypothetical protein